MNKRRWHFRKNHNSYNDTHEDRERRLSRRTFLLGSFGLGVAAYQLRIMDEVFSEIRWPPTPMKINLVNGCEGLPTEDEEWLVFGGFGQQDSKNAGAELFGALDEKKVVSTVVYPSDYFDIAELAVPVAEYIKSRRMKKLNLVGVSMGLPTALMVLRYIAQNPQLLAEEDDGSDICKPPIPLPEIGYVAAYSSPADLDDAMQGELARPVTTWGKKLRIPTDIAAKFAYSLIDGNGDKLKALNIVNQKQWQKHLSDSLSQTYNKTPPRMTWSQLKLLHTFNFEEQWQDWRDIIGEQTKFGYVATDNEDYTVRKTAFGKYDNGFKKLNVKTIDLLSSGNSDHAETAPSAVAIGQWMNKLALAA